MIRVHALTIAAQVVESQVVRQWANSKKPSDSMCWSHLSMAQLSVLTKSTHFAYPDLAVACGEGRSLPLPAIARGVYSRPEAVR